MLDTSLESIRREIESAERFRDAHISNFTSMVERYHGPAYRDDKADFENDDPENFAHEYVSLILPRIIHDNPKFRVKSGRPSVDMLVSKRLQIAMNRWSRVTFLRRTLERIATDMLFGWGVGLVVSEPRGEVRSQDGMEPYLPRIYRISPERFFIDPAASNWEDARYMGHCYVVDKEDLLRKAAVDNSWDADAISDIAANTDVDEARPDNSRSRDIENRNELTVYELWVPEVNDAAAHLLDDVVGSNLVHGTIYTVVKSGKGQSKWSGYVRKPIPYYGPKNGPYAIFGVYTVPDDPYPLSPLVAIQSQVEDLNRHLSSMRSSAAAYKRLIMVDSRNHKLAQDIKDRPHDYVVISESLDKDRVMNLEIGGITTQQVNYSQLAQDRLDRNSGIHDAMRGNISGAATATEVAVAESSATMRMAHLKRQFQDAVDEMARKVMWFMWHDNRISLPLGDEGMRALLEADPVFTGGVMMGGWEEMEIAVDSYSMERVSEALVQKRALEMLQITTNVAQAAMALPNVKWRDLLSIIGDAMNIPNLGDIVDTGSGPSPAASPMMGMGAGPEQSVAPRDARTNAMGEPSPIPASSVAGLRAVANRV
jgi:hypothetical protein